MTVSPAFRRSRPEGDEFKASLRFVGETVLKGEGGGISAGTVMKTMDVTEEEWRYCHAGYVDCNPGGCRVA